MASLTEFIHIYIEWLLRIFHRFIWSAPDIEDISQKAVFVTGCDTGFGHLTALTLNEAGFHVLAGCLFPDKDGARGLQIKAKYPTKMTVIPIDVTNDLTVRMAYEETERYLQKNHLQLHALINNAGICPTFEVEWGSIDLFKRTLDVNTIGMVLVTKTFLPLIRAAEGRIINVNSIAARYSVPVMVAYCMSKHASLAFTEGLRREMTKFNVRVISIEPGFYNTPMANTDLINKQMETVWREADPLVKESYGDHYFKRVYKQTPLILKLTNQDASEVPANIKHAVMNQYPLHNYLVDGSWFRWVVIIGMYLTPQESLETAWKAITYFNGRDRPLPGNFDDKKRT